MKTRAAQLRKPGKVVLVERELTLAEDEVLVKAHLSGICGSDKAMYRGNIPEKFSLPFYLGHESGGTVVEVGAKVREYRPGDRVMVFKWCNTFADYFAVPVAGLQPIPEGLDMDLGCLGEPIGCAMYSGLTCGAQPVPRFAWKTGTSSISVRSSTRPAMTHLIVITSGCPT